MAEAWEIDGLCGEAASIAHRLLCDLLLAGGRSRPRGAAERSAHLARAAARWPSLTSTMAALDAAAPVSAGEGRADDEALQRVVENCHGAADVVAEAGGFAAAMMDDLRQAAASGERERKRAFLIRAFAAWPKLARRMARVVQAQAEAEDMARGGEAANAVRGGYASSPTSA